MIQEDGDICLIDFNISIDGESNKELIGLSSQFASPEQAKKALEAGAFALVVGGAITRPAEITSRFVSAIRK